MKILIVKISALGDVIQALAVLEPLAGHVIDWAVDEKISPLVQAHPLIRKAIPIVRGQSISSIRELRKERYDVVFDLQGNCKSALFTFAAKAKEKVGFGWRSVREWPNLLATHHHYEVDERQNMRLQYLSLIESYFKTTLSLPEPLLANRTATAQNIMICPGARWINKQLPVATWIAFLNKIEGANFVLVWGDSQEKAMCEEILKAVRGATLSPSLSLLEWQKKMQEMDLVIALDSSALHLAGASQIPTFSIFGPTVPDLFKPLGDEHVSYWGSCPYAKKFKKRCPILRTCPTGACMKSIEPEALYQAFNACRILSKSTY